MDRWTGQSDLFPNQKLCCIKCRQTPKVGLITSVRNSKVRTPQAFKMLETELEQYPCSTVFSASNFKKKPALEIYNMAELFLP